MSNQPMLLSGECFIDRGLSLCGFWLGRWIRSVTTEERDNMLKLIAVFDSFS
jgi:hypothetical protein